MPALRHRLHSYWRLARVRPSDLLRRIWDRFRVAVAFATGGLVFRWHGHLLDMRDPVLARAAGMTTLEERAFLAWWARERYCGKGVVVELGPFIGASTVALCHGVLANKRVVSESRRVRVYDRFVCDEFMAELINKGLHSTSLAGAHEAPLREGDSSLPAFSRQTADYQSRIDLYPGDLLSYQHDGAPVELLFVDAMKTPELAEHTVRQFFGSLLPRRALLVQQDFVHYWTSWIHLIQWDLREWCKFACHVPRSASAVFTVRKAIDCAPAYRLNLLGRSDAEIEEAFGYSLSLISGDLRENIHAAKAMHYYHTGQEDRCKEMVDRYLRENPAAGQDMLAMADLLKARPGAGGFQ